LADKQRIYAEAKEAGINTKALRKVIAERRMTDREEIVARMHEYRVALGMAVNDVANGASVRKAATKYGVSKSTLHRHAVPREDNPKWDSLQKRHLRSRQRCQPSLPPVPRSKSPSRRTTTERRLPQRLSRRLPTKKTAGRRPSCLLTMSVRCPTSCGGR